MQINWDKWSPWAYNTTYQLYATEYNQLLHANVTKTYKKANKQKLSKINEEAKTITEKLNMSNRIESMATKEGLTTLKDSKEISRACG